MKVTQAQKGPQHHCHCTVQACREKRALKVGKKIPTEKCRVASHGQKKKKTRRRPGHPAREKKVDGAISDRLLFLPTNHSALHFLIQQRYSEPYFSSYFATNMSATTRAIRLLAKQQPARFVSFHSAAVRAPIRQHLSRSAAVTTTRNQVRMAWATSQPRPTEDIRHMLTI